MPVVSPALLVKFVIFVDIQDLTKKAPHIGRLTFPLWGVFLGLNSTPAIAAQTFPFDAPVSVKPMARNQQVVGEVREQFLGKKAIRKKIDDYADTVG